MADERYDADGDVTRYMFDDMEFPTFADEPDAATLPFPRPTAPATQVEPPLADLGHPVLADLGTDVDLNFVPEMNFQPQPPAMNAGGHTHQATAMHLPHQQQPLAPSPPAHGFNGQPTTDAAGGDGAAPSGDDGNLFYDPSPDAVPSTDFDFMDLNFNIDDVNIDDVLMWDDDGKHGGGGGGDNPPVIEYANFVRFHVGDLDCSNCHLVREVMHANDSRTIYFLVHATGVGSFQHAIVDRRYPAGADGYVPESSQLLYFDLTNHTDESASDFITRNIENLRNDTSGQFLDTGYPNFFIEAARIDMTNHHTAMEMNMLHTIMSAPAENAADAASPAAQPPAAPPAAELRAAPQEANAQSDSATITISATVLLHLEEFHAAANNRPVPKSDVKILESSQVTQQDRGSATMYPSMEARKGKRKATPSLMTPRQILEYLRVTTEETEKELAILNPFFKNRSNNKKNDDEKDPISYPVEQLRNIKKKMVRFNKKASTIMPSRLPATLVDEIDTIKDEKAKAYEEIIKAVKYPRKKDDDGSSRSKRNVGRRSAKARK
ncbi:hypothetical protein E2562_028311 [Oryza meyeriana var. granulata]|uniref:Uncharacterized protein n=1 Tax=Oryza meyeriana var. granulata TaxID=110450 RepID=A0A6G1FCU8_9ORYZ|nr:hypothetical protein E2562_028311 [Oryza meyeriana var. granulata]